MKLALSLALLIATSAFADTITFESMPLSGTSGNFTTTYNVAITPDAHWAPNQPNGAEWISFENTGIGGTVLPNSTGVNDPGAVFYQSFIDYTGTVLDVSLTVWADDSTSIYLIGPDTDVQLAQASFGQDTYCAPAPAITCTGAGTTFNFSVAPGAYSLQFPVYQIGGGPFGVMWEGTVTSVGNPPTSTVAEPGSLGLMGVCLLAVGIGYGRRKRRA